MWNKFQTLHFKRFSKTALPLFGPILHKSILSKNSEKMLCKLKNRVIIKVIGKEANNFVQNLVTANIIKLENGKLLFGLFLNRKSEILADCFFFGQDNDVLIDCAKEKSTFLLDHLSKYNLRKKVDIKLEEPPSIYVYSGKKLRMRKNVYDDPRAALLGKRIYDYNNDFLKEKIEETTNENFYSAHLATNGIQNTITSEMKDCNPFSLNYDLLNAIDFKKGCYLGQELVSQIHSTGSVRKRLLPALIIKNSKIDEMRMEDILEKIDYGVRIDFDLKNEHGNKNEVIKFKNGLKQIVGKVYEKPKMGNVVLVMMKKNDMNLDDKMYTEFEGHRVFPYLPSFWIK